MVSVIMPVYNAEDYLGEAVESILGQTLRDFELIAVDDGSTDGSGAILDGYQDRDIRVRVVHRRRKGIVAALNAGLRLARGKYIARMDGDDVSLPGRLENQVSFMEAHPEVGVCGTGWRFIGDRAGGVAPPARDEDIRAGQLFWPSMAHPTVMMRRDLIAEHDLYYDPEFKQAEDYELWSRFSRHCRMANIPGPLLLYRTRADQSTARFRSDVARWSSPVHARVIRQLGVEPSDGDLEVHAALAGMLPMLPVLSEESFLRHEAWLLRLRAANETRHAYEPAILNKLLFQVWHSFCSRAAEQRVWAWPAFRRSRLSDGLRIPIRCGLSFALRYALGGRARAAYCRLSRYSAVRRTMAALVPRTVRGD